MENKTTRICDTVIEWGLLLMVPLIAVAQSTISYTPILIKATLLQSGSIIVFAAWIIKTFEQRRFVLNNPRMIIPAFVFMLSAIFSFVFISPSKDTSIDDLLLRIPCFLIFFVTAVSFTDFNKVRKVFVAVICTVFFVSLYGVLQRLGWDPFQVAFSFERISSFFGNPNFYVGFLTLVFPAVLSSFDFSNVTERKKSLIAIAIVFASTAICFGTLLLTTSNTLHIVVVALCFFAVIFAGISLQLKIKTAALATMFLLLMNILLTGSRSGLIGLGAGSAIFLVLTMVFVVQAKPLRKLGILFAVLALCATGVVAGVLQITRSDEGRLKTVSERKYYVIGAINLIKQHPFLGHGIGTFKNNYPLVKPRESWAYNASCFEHVSNVYNEHLEVFHDEGLLGLSVYAWMLLVFLVLSIMAIRASAGMPDRFQSSIVEGKSVLLRLYASTPPAMMIGLLSGVAALLIVNIFSLSMRYPSTGFVFWLFMGLLSAQVALVLYPEQTRFSPAIVNKTLDDRSASGQVMYKLRYGFDTLIIVGVVLFISFSFRLYRADIYLNDAIDHSKSAYVVLDTTSSEVFHNVFIEGARYHSIPIEWEYAIESYRKSLAYNPFNLRARYFFGNAFNLRWNQTAGCNQAWGDGPGQSRTDADRAIEQYEYIYRQAPHYSEIDYEMGDLYRKLGNLENAIYYYKEYKRYMPFFTKVHYALADAYVANKDWLNAAEAYKDALDLNQRFTMAYGELGAVYHKLGKEDLSVEMIEKAREISPDKFDQTMIDIWVKFSEPEMAVKICRARIAMDSTNAASYASLGWLAIRRQEWQSAISAYEKAVAINPNDVAGLVNLSNLYYQVGKIEASKEAFQKAVKIDSVFVRSMLDREPTKN